MSAKPTHDRDYFLARIARALGCAGYAVEECDAIMAWVHGAHPAHRGNGQFECRACRGSGRQAAHDEGAVASGREQLDGMDTETRFLVQGICLACRGRGFTT